MVSKFNNQVAFITGASRGIGKQIAKELAQQGAHVGIIDINEKELEKTTNEFLAEGLKVIAKKANVVHAEEVEKAMLDVAETYGRIDILVNNAGIIRDNLLFKMTDDNWQHVMDVHLNGAFNASRAAQKYMVEQGYGRIINISSTSALGNRGQANYSTAKAGLQGLTKTLAIELGKFGITVNAVAPGFIETDMTHETAERMRVSFEELVKFSLGSIPVGISGKPSDIAHAVTFFADQDSSFINGQVLYVAGGPQD